MRRHTLITMIMAAILLLLVSSCVKVKYGVTSSDYSRSYRTVLFSNKEYQGTDTLDIISVRSYRTVSDNFLHRYFYGLDEYNTVYNVPVGNYSNLMFGETHEETPDTLIRFYVADTPIHGDIFRDANATLHLFNAKAKTLDYDRNLGQINLKDYLHIDKSIDNIVTPVVCNLNPLLYASSSCQLGLSDELAVVEFEPRDITVHVSTELDLILENADPGTVVDPESIQIAGCLNGCPMTLYLWDYAVKYSSDNSEELGKVFFRFEKGEDGIYRAMARTFGIMAPEAPSFGAGNGILDLHIWFNTIKVEDAAHPVTYGEEDNEDQEEGDEEEGDEEEEGDDEEGNDEEGDDEEGDDEEGGEEKDDPKPQIARTYYYTLPVNLWNDLNATPVLKEMIGMPDTYKIVKNRISIFKAITLDIKTGNSTIEWIPGEELEENEGTVQ